MYLDPIIDKIEYNKQIDYVQKLINDFMKQPDVMSGSAFNMGANRPKGWHEAISTTGYCVKVSDVFMKRMLWNKKLFQNCQLLSITIDPNKWGRCGDGSHNAWHTCCDTGNGYVVDLTIEQFGSKYANKFVWPKVEWLKEFVFKFDSHSLGYMPTKDWDILNHHLNNNR